MSTGIVGYYARSAVLDAAVTFGREDRSGHDPEPP
jgi:hypothetical protein